jgi:glucokinase
MIAAIDIGGTKIAVGMVTAKGKLLVRREGPTGATGPYSDAIPRVIEVLRAVAKETGEKITGIGIGCTGPINPFTGEIGEVNHFPQWQGNNPIRDLQKEFRVSVAMENDADAAALGEAGWGAGKHKKRMIYVTVGTGIGVSVLIDGAVYRGVDGAHPEMGHHLIDPSGPACSCGFNGCWEAFAAGPGMVTWIRENAPPDYEHRAHLSGQLICELARQSDSVAKRAVEHEARYLGLGIANLVTLFAPDAIVMGGSVMKSADLFMDTIHATVRASCRYVPYEQAEIRLASLGEDTNLIGAARVWYHRFSANRATDNRNARGARRTRKVAGSKIARRKKGRR